MAIVPIPVTLYSRPGCHLCEAVAAELMALAPQYPHTLTEINIEDNDSLLRQYFDKIPVVVAGNHTLTAPITPADLTSLLARAHATARSSSEIV